MIHSKCLWAATVCVALTAGMASAVPVFVDFQVSRTTGVTAPGYVGMDNAQRWDTSTQVTVADGVLGGWTSFFNGGTRDRATSTALLRDFVTWSGGTTQSPKKNTFKLTGLAAGDYNLALYSYDPSYPASVYKTSVGIDGNNDGVNETSYVQLQGATPVTAPVTVSSAGILQLTFGTTDTFAGIINGFDLVPTPEPATLAMVLMSAGWLIRRRR
jgi:hypothetical protein